MDGRKDTAGVAVEHIFRLCIANIVDGTAGDGLQIDIRFGAHLTHDAHLPRRDKCLDGRAGLGVVGQELVEQRVANLVAYFVGVSLRHRL